jgi:predicted CxxxxCH...CXXCH cytochrome family protein
MTSQALGISASTACTDCHGTVTLAGATHMNGSTTFTWSALATKSGALTPTYTAATGACANTYCHGNSMPGGDTTGSNKSPTWINPNYLPATISSAACGLCHGFPPSAATGHPAGITIPAGFPATASIGTTCSCHSNINSAGNSYATIFVNPALHINGILETPSSGHSFPYSGSLHLGAAGTTPWSACNGCHSTAAGGTYPVAAGTAPICTGCHLQGLNVPSATSSCWDCHGASATDGLPNGTVFPNIAGSHSKHAAIPGTTCATCHTGAGAGVASHGSQNRTAKVRADVTVAFPTTGTWNGSVALTCSSTYCHRTAPSPVWGSGTTTCVSCHDAISTGLALRHDKHYNSLTAPTVLAGGVDAHTAANYVYSCLACHPSNQHSSGPASAVAPFQDAAVTGTKISAYVKGSVATTDARGLNYTTNGTCTSVCHTRDGVTAGSAVVAQNWGTTPTGTCGVCHNQAGDAAPVWSTPHTKHINTYAANTNITCNSCHAGTAASNSALQATVQARNQHPNANRDVAMNTFATGGAVAISGAQGSQTCTNTYCHSNGTVAAGTHGAISWTGTFSTCAECHGNAASLATGSHAKHLAVAGITCDKCHNATASSNTTISGFANHVNKNVTINFAATVAPAGGTYNGQIAGGATVYQKAVGTAAGACATNTCHGTNSGTWGVVNADATCVKCHGVVGTTPAAYTATINTAAPGYNGTGVNTGGTVGAISGGVSSDAKVGAHDVHLRGVGGYKTGGVACADCHAVTALGDAGHMNGSSTMTWSNLARNVGTTPYNADKGAIVPSYTAPTCATNYCHGGGFAAAVQGTGISVSWVDGTYLVNAAATKNAADCNKCHQSPPTSSLKFAHTSLTIASDCAGCHGHNGSGPTHIDGILQATGGVSSGGSPCYGCHATYNVMNSSTSSFHHVLDNASPDQAPNTGTYPSSQTVLACTSCHTDHNYTNVNKGANLRTSYNAAASLGVNTDFSTTTPYGLCVSCHSTAQTKSTAQTVAGTAATIVIDGSATGFQASAHNYTVASLFGASPFNANCVKCHTDEQAKDKQTSAAPNEFGPHYSIQRSLLNPMGATTQAAAGADFCYRCHSKTTDTSPGGGAAKTTALKDYFGSVAMTADSEDIFSTMQLANRHNVSSYKGSHKDDETRAGIAAVKHVECVDCHDPHLAKSGTHTAGSATLAGVLTGVSGVGVTTWGTNWTGATTYNPATTSAALITATAEWQVCFKCHSGANANVATWGGAGAAAWTDAALEFNPNNASGHPVVAALPVANRLTAARLTGGWTPGSIMTCTDCHATDSAASKGPHGSSVKWMLTGINKAWPYTTAAGNGGGTGTLYRIANYNTGAGTVNGLFCLNCHTIRPATGVNNWHSNTNLTAGQHGGGATGAAVCANCHIRVPHGGKISRLLQTVNAPVRYRANGSSGTALYDFWGTSTVNIKGSAFASGNFNSSCSQHNSGGTGGEAW